MPFILFVCTGNLYRSPLAAALFSQKLQADGQSEGWTVESAGTWTVPGQRVPPDALRVAKTMRLDLTCHRTRQVDQDLLANADLILVMERGHKEALMFEFPSVQKKLHLLSQIADQLPYDIPDPATSGLPFHEIAAELLKLIHRSYAGICQLASQQKAQKTA